MMDSDSAPGAADPAGRAHSNSISQQSRASCSQDSQTAADFLRDQEILEADAREALPYSIDTCTKIFGPLRQSVFACLTCNPAPASPGDPFTPAGICYACSVQCHGDHKLVEIFQKRGFTCDCGTTRFPSTSPCGLRINSATNTKGNVHSEQPDANNRYNLNFQNRFCCCECDYDPFQQTGTMFQCLGLGSRETGGCGEDWYHPGCLVGQGPKWFENTKNPKPKLESSNGGGGGGAGGLNTISEVNEEQQQEGGGSAPKNDTTGEDADDDPPMPAGFPEEEDFEGLLCYKCVDANPWIKQYAGTAGFLPPVFLDPTGDPTVPTSQLPESPAEASKKRKAPEDDPVDVQPDYKRVKSENGDTGPQTLTERDQPPTIATGAPASRDDDDDQKDRTTGCKLLSLPPPPSGRFSLFLKENFRDNLCRCSDCYPRLDRDPQLLEEEESYEPPLSAGGSEHGGGGGGGGSTVGSGSLLERGESALRNVDRVRAIEGVMAYNHLKEQLKPFFERFAKTGTAVSAEDIKTYFAQLRGDAQGIREAGEAARTSAGNDGEGDGRREQDGY